MQFDFLYYDESESFSYFRMPRIFFTDEPYVSLSTDAKLLYGIMLDRVGLSRQNDWFDDDGRVFIIFSIAEICDVLKYKRDKVMKLLAELDDSKGIGLIHRKRRGQGKTDLIYVKNFISNRHKAAPQAAEKRSRKNRSQEVDFADRNYLNVNSNDREMEKSAAVSLLNENIDYDTVATPIGGKQYDIDLIDEMIEIASDAMSDPATMLKVGQTERRAYAVRERMLQLRQPHIHYVYDNIRKVEDTIKNMRAYVLAALYNAPSTLRLHDSQLE